MKRLLQSMLILFMITCNLPAQNAAVSSHTNFGTDITGDITISEVRVPSNGVTLNTYYETLGFWGNKGNSTGNGYGGIQESSDGRGNKVHIFSIWHALDNPNDTANFPYAVHLAYGMRAEYFGGEGVGLKTWNLTSDPNHPLYWQPDVWYTHVVRAWDVGNHTYYGFFVRDGVKGIWQHLSTIGVRESSIRIKGRNDAFIEDWSGSGQNMREIHLRGNWRRDLQGKWNAAQTGAYSVNDWDLAPGKRSYNYRYNWNGGINSDATGEYYFMTTGGANTSPTPPLNFPNKTSNSYSISVSASKPNFPTAKVATFRVEDLNGKLAVEWEMDSTTLPLFSYSIEIYDNATMAGSPVVSKSVTAPHVRVDTLEISSLDSENNKYYVSFKAVDIFDGKATEKTATFGQGEITPYISLLSPTGGESLLHGDTLRISWKTNQSDSCFISLIHPTEATVSLATISAATTSYLWTIADFHAESDEYKITISLKAAPTVTDSSATFSITPPDSTHWLLEQSKLSVHSFTNEQNSTSDAAANVLDGDSATIWHTLWNGSVNHPHEIVLKADKAYYISGLLYLPRQSGSNGRINEYEIYLSEDGSNWGKAITTGTFGATATEKRIEFPSTKASYIKLVSLSEISDQAFTSVAELNVLHDLNGGKDAVTTIAKAKVYPTVSLSSKTVSFYIPQKGNFTIELLQPNGRSLWKKSIQGERIEILSLKENFTGVAVLTIRGTSLSHSQRVLLK